MLPLILGFVAVFAAFYLMRWFSTAQTKNVRRSLPWGAISVILLVLVVLAGTGRLAAALAGLAALVVWGLRVMSMIQMGKQFSGLFGKKNAGSQGPPPPNAAPPQTMATDEAYRILGLSAGASEADIKAAYKRVIGQLHPDRGGTDYLAAKVNQAKDLLLDTRKS